MSGQWSRLVFSSGGHIENGESAKAALLRELYEEIGSVIIKSLLLLGYAKIFSYSKKVFFSIK
jgi:8-oxo-dGTP pyrophosphatase MutT (NUDIX family)